MSGGPEIEISRRRQTIIFSWEFVIAVAANVVAFTYFATISQAQQDARLDLLEAQQVTDARIARLEEKMQTVIDNQKDLKAIAKALQDQRK
jgi:transcriptional regulator GlxA family with amidase domain